MRRFTYAFGALVSIAVLLSACITSVPQTHSFGPESEKALLLIHFPNGFHGFGQYRLAPLDPETGAPSSPVVKIAVGKEKDGVIWLLVEVDPGAYVFKEAVWPEEVSTGFDDMGMERTTILNRVKCYDSATVRFELSAGAVFYLFDPIALKNDVEADRPFPAPDLDAARAILAGYPNVTAELVAAQPEPGAFDEDACGPAFY